MKTATIIARSDVLGSRAESYTRECLRQMAEEDSRLTFDEATGALTMDVELADRQEVLETLLATGKIRWTNEGEEPVEAASNTQESPSPRDLYYQAKGNPEKYRALLRQNGLLVRRTETPKPHVFKGLTKLCLCSDCQGRFDAPWHVARV